MATIQDNIAEVREMIGEPAEADSMFTDDRVTAWINSTSSLEAAALRGWRAKAANFANLITVTDGAASREMSDLLDHAETMIKMYTSLAKGPSAGRTRVGKIVHQ